MSIGIIRLGIPLRNDFEILSASQSLELIKVSRSSDVKALRLSVRLSKLLSVHAAG